MKGDTRRSRTGDPQGKKMSSVYARSYGTGFDVPVYQGAEKQKLKTKHSSDTIDIILNMDTDLIIVMYNSSNVFTEHFKRRGYRQIRAGEEKYSRHHP